MTTVEFRVNPSDAHCVEARGTHLCPVLPSESQPSEEWVRIMCCANARVARMLTQIFIAMPMAFQIVLWEDAKNGGTNV